MTRLLAVVVVVVVVVVVACGGRAPAPRTPDVAPQPASPAAPATTVVAAAQPSERECDRLLEHAVTLAIAERPADQRLADPERARLADELRGEFRARCTAMSRAAYDCAVAAATTSAIGACR